MDYEDKPTGMAMGIQMRLTVCPVCGVVFYLPEAMARDKEQHRGAMFCPNSHRFSYAVESVEELKARLEKSEQSLRDCERQLEKWKGEYRGVADRSVKCSELESKLYAVRLKYTKTLNKLDKKVEALKDAKKTIEALRIERSKGRESITVSGIRPPIQVIGQGDKKPDAKKRGGGAVAKAERVATRPNKSGVGRREKK